MKRLRIDYLAAMSLLLFFIANSIEIARRSAQRDDLPQQKWALWKDLNPDYLRDRWVDRVTSSWLNPLGEVFGAMAWISLVVPVVEVAWIQSLGGKRRMALHGSVVLLVLSGAFAELVGRFMAVGVEDAARRLVARFELDDWDTSANGDADGMGWRVLDLGHMVFLNGLLQWIDAFEWIALFGCLSLLYLSVHQKHGTFSTRWTALGLLIAILSIADFAAEVARLDSWITASEVSLALKSLNSMVLLPIWLLWLAIRLPWVRDDCDRLFERDEDDNNDTNDSQERAALNQRAQFPIPAPPRGTLGQDVIGQPEQAELASKPPPTEELPPVDTQVEEYASKLKALADKEIL